MTKRSPRGRNQVTPAVAQSSLGYRAPFSGTCQYRECGGELWPGLPVCKKHAIAVYVIVSEELKELGRMSSALLEREDPNIVVLARIAGHIRPKPDPNSVVYYLRIRPDVVKIGFTVDLKTRLSQLRTDMQYVMAVESGGRELEAERHKQFARERIGRREDFTLTERLHDHIDSLSA